MRMFYIFFFQFPSMTVSLHTLQVIMETLETLEKGVKYGHN